MNPRATKVAALGAMALGLSLTAAHADTFGSGSNAFTIDFVDIGNPGERFYKAVNYNYRMGVTEAPQDWITKATNLGMANVTAGRWTGLQPATNMTWYEAAAFVNWLNTSTGHQAAYNLTAIPPDTLGNTWSITEWSTAQVWQLGGRNFYRHKDAYYFLPSDHEWYKAAYHKNDGVTGNYWNYATGSNSIPTAVASGTGAGTAVYDGQLAPATVNNDGGLSAYGTRGQNGNVYEWTESFFGPRNRAYRGGYWLDTEFYLTHAHQDHLSFSPTDSFEGLGFRVASVPEPSCAILMLSGSLLALARRRRRTAANWPSFPDVKRSLLNVRLAGIALLGFAGVSSVQGVILEPTVEATIADGPGLWPPNDGIPDYVMLGVYVQTLHASPGTLNIGAS